MLPYLILLLISVPIAEIYFLIKIGGAIGGGYTILFIILTAILGSYLLRREGLSVLRDFSNMQQGGNISELLAQGILVLLAGVLLLTPGFLTDGAGFLMILPWSRRYLAQSVARWFIANMGRRVFHNVNVNEGSDVEDIDYEIIDDKDKGEKA